MTTVMGNEHDFIDRMSLAFMRECVELATEYERRAARDREAERAANRERMRRVWQLSRNPG